MRLGQWAEGSSDQWMEPALWGTRSTGLAIPDGSEVCLALDGSFSQDSTALVAATVSTTPHLDVVGHWANPGDKEWRVDVLAVDDSPATIEGEESGKRMVVIRFDSREAFDAFWQSPEYQEMAKIRFESADTTINLVQEENILIQ